MISPMRRYIDFGNLQGMVDGLGVDFGCLKSEVDSIRTGIGWLETSMTEQVRGVSSQIREMFQMSGLLSGNKNIQKFKVMLQASGQVSHEFPVARGVLVFLERLYKRHL